MNIDQIELKTNVLVLALRDIVVFPGMVVPLFVGRKKSMASLNMAMKQDKQIFLVSQKKSSQESPKQEDLYKIGVMANILQLLKLPDGTLKVLVEGIRRFELIGFEYNGEFLIGDIQELRHQKEICEDENALINAVKKSFQRYADSHKKIPSEVQKNIQKTSDINKLIDTISGNLKLTIEDKQSLSLIHI